MHNPCQDATVGGPTSVNLPTIADQTVNLDDASPHVITVGFIQDTVSTANGNSLFCGARQYSFERTDTGVIITDLI